MNKQSQAERPAASEPSSPVVAEEVPYVWSIGIYLGESPFNFLPAPEIENPVLTFNDVTDVPASFLADPFMLRVDDTWYMYFEVMNRARKQGEIGLATSSNALHWQYQRIVLAEPYHLSYPYVFEWDGDYYMMPETLQPGSVRLYKAEAFPDRWSLVGELLHGQYADSSLFRFDDRWWLYTCSTPFHHDTLRLYFADELLGRWREHPRSPVISGDKSRARPGGRVLAARDRVIRYTQDCHPNYGTQVRAFEISTLTTSDYHEEERAESPVLTASGDGWNKSGMHHIDPHRLDTNCWIACVDGLSYK